MMETHLSLTNYADIVTHIAARMTATYHGLVTLKVQHGKLTRVMTERECLCPKTMVNAVDYTSIWSTAERAVEEMQTVHYGRVEILMERGEVARLRAIDAGLDIVIDATAPMR